MFALILVTSAFCWYLSWARRVRVAPARLVTDTQTHYEYCNLAPAWARLIILHDCTVTLENPFLLGKHRTWPTATISSQVTGV